MTPVEQPTPKPTTRVILVAALLAIAVAGTGGSLTILDDWYFSLNQPWFKPPDWAFGPAWTILFGLMAWSGALGWAASTGQAVRRKQLILLWTANAVFNIGWSLLFFFLQRPELALMEVPLLWASVFMLIRHKRAYAPKAAMLLWPYLAWVTLASAINLGVVVLN